MRDDSTQATPQDNKSNTTIIIKRITPSSHAHHGGAWKVAYADFVTAMMAFFLLLWLLNSVPTEKLTGIAEYFDPTVGLSGEKGIGFEGGSTSQQDKGNKQDDRAVGFKYGVARTGNIVAMPQAGIEIASNEVENERFAVIEGELKKAVSEDQNLQDLKDNITLSMTPEGLEIQITDQDKYPMFEAGGDELTTHAKNIIFKIAKLIRFSPNFIAVTGHTNKDSINTESSYTNWELSTDRANAARRYLISSGIAAEQISKIVGKADTEPVDPDLYSSKNRRISVTLLRNSLMPYHKISVPKELLNGTQSENTPTSSAPSR